LERVFLIKVIPPPFGKVASNLRNDVPSFQ
jgi:hypothetical protein